MIVEDIASQSNVVFDMQRNRISGVYVSSGSAETLVSKDEITNNYSIVYSLK